MKPAAAVWRLGILSAVTIALFILLANAITQPVAPNVRAYTAEFTDASGLYAGADVRVRGVRVGKVQSVELKRRNGQSVAAVALTLERRFGIVPATRLAIKYQSLTGSRYVDVVNPSESYKDAELVRNVSTAMTQPSFDVTALFNGLQPVLATLSPDDINAFVAHAVDFLSGNGGGLAPMLDSIRTLTKFVSDREQVVATVMRNLSTVADAMGGQSPHMIQILEWINRPLDAALSVIKEFRKTALNPDYMSAAERLLENIGFPSTGNHGDHFVMQPPGAPATDQVTNLDEGLDRAINNLDDFISAIKLVPVMWDNIGPPPHASAPLPCSHGHFQLPEQMDILLNGQRVVLCKH
ncbi:MlaD family protein [Mycobacterium palustre]|uniref:Mammalian cell entry protein n=1 Tax=Mycobacterium palustre TaxID=153971 RepID=A0A1X1ZM19_9MYCO|nr:MlaD family protein [Mycobacterium palustre]ORW24335.1 mammalian cell entry protein [Mycobacterium palustre]